MAKLWYGHFDSTQDDPRLLLAEDWANYIKSFITDGIRDGGNTLKITAGSGMKLLMDEGTANIQGYIFQSVSDGSGRYHEIQIDTAHPSLPRIDRVVLRLNRSIEERKIMPVVILGNAATNPVAPALVRDGVVWDLCLAQVRVDAGAVGITASKITDTRFNTDLCGLINSVLGLDPSSWQKEFDEFLAAIKTENTAFLSQRLTQFNNQLAQFDSQFTGQKTEYNAWFSSVQNNLPIYAGFDFDDPANYPGTKTDITFPNSTTVSEVKRVTASNVKIAERITVFNVNGSVTETVTVYDAATGAQIWQRTLTTTFTGSDIKEEVV